MRILITGGRGFLGRHLIARLVDHDVYAPARERLNLLHAYETLRYFYNDPFDVVIHLAATVGGIGFNQSNPVRCLNENLLMATNLFQAMAENPPGKFIAVGSVCAYPKFCPVPFKEDDLWSGYPEETNAPYGIAKRVLLAQCHAYRQGGLNAIYLLPANMYGPADNFDLETSHIIPALIRKCIEGVDPVEVWGDGAPTRDFLYVDDCAEAIVQAMEGYDDGEPVNIGTGREISIAEVAQMIGEATGYKGRFRFNPTRPGGQPRRVLDVSKAKAFGFIAQTSLEDGLRKTVEWYRSRMAVAA